jgi:predicted AAA+ superfamily ATPase
MALRRNSPEIFYYKTDNGKEVDFVVKREKEPVKLIQVCETLADPQTRKREISALDIAMKEMDLTSGVLVTGNEEETISTKQGKVTIQPAWKFLLEWDLPDSIPVPAREIGKSTESGMKGKK